MDLTTTYLGMTLKNPVVASASPLSSDVDKIKKLESGAPLEPDKPLEYSRQIRRQ